MKDFGMEDEAVDLRADNQGAISVAKDFKNNAATKHVDVAYHLTRDYVSKNLVKISYAPSRLMVADGATKS